MTTHNWNETNQRYLAEALSSVKHALECYITNIQGTAEPEQVQQADQEDIVDAMPEAALTQLCIAFGLSPFERALLLLCAGMEFDSSFAALCATAQQQTPNERNDTLGAPYPTFSLALAALPAAHWDALTPVAPLRHWRLLEIDAGHTLTQSRLRIDERILHYLAGVSYLDERLASSITFLSLGEELVPSHRMVAERLIAAWQQTTDHANQLPGWSEAHMLPIVQLCGEDNASKQAIAASACSAMQLNLGMLAAEALPTTPGEITALLRLWEREAILSHCALLLDCAELDTNDTARTSAVNYLLKHLHSPLIISRREQQYTPGQRPILTFDVNKPGSAEQRSTWHNLLGSMQLHGNIDALTAQFSLNIADMRSVCTEVLNASTVLHAEHAGLDTAQADLDTLLWHASRVRLRPRLENLAQRVELSARWDDLVLPEAQQQQLHEIAANVRQRTTVYETWGFSSKGVRGLGISALFAGSSGTGKTLAAEVLAHKLQLDLYRIDLSSVVSKYIGETEKHLRQIFDAAEAGGAILLFDEADALFGKRSEVKDSHDRYANIEVSYLLQRIEAYRGLSILTTNLKSALDNAFLRRIRFIVQFPFPNGEQRAEIWRRTFPQQMPTENLDVNKLARLSVTGGNIRNIVLSAAFLAADSHEPVRMKHLLRAAGTEYAKLEKSLTEAEVGGWT